MVNVVLVFGVVFFMMIVVDEVVGFVVLVDVLLINLGILDEVCWIVILIVMEVVRNVGKFVIVDLVFVDCFVLCFVFVCYIMMFLFFMVWINEVEMVVFYLECGDVEDLIVVGMVFVVIGLEDKIESWGEDYWLCNGYFLMVWVMVMGCVGGVVLVVFLSMENDMVLVVVCGFFVFNIVGEIVVEWFGGLGMFVFEFLDVFYGLMLNDIQCCFKMV